MNKNLSHIKKTALVSALLLELTAANAATINVDGTTCTLSDAITAANTDAVAGGCTAGAGDDVLELDSAGSPFTQTAALPNVTSNITMNGNGSIVERDAASPEFPVIYLDGGGTAVLNDLSITGGSSANTATNFGGGVVVRPGSSVEINDSIISGNNGGAVWLYNSGPSSINNSVVENNTSNPGAYYTGGVSINGGYLDINNSTISGNTNVATTAGGGGLYVTDYSGTATVGVSNSTITGNSALNSGGGIATISFGVNSIELNINSSTITLNASQANGGGIASNGGDVAVSQSLLSGNTAVAASQWEAIGGAYATVDAYNIFGESSASGLSGVTPGTYDIVPTVGVSEIFDTNLTDNGGPTPTHALIETGPGVDAITNCLFNVDQTGKSRPIDGNADGSALCDVGAFENENPDVIFKDGFD